MLRTRICDLFGIELPIVCAGMGTVAMAELAAAVSEAGGMGTIGMAGTPPEGVHAEIETARRLTKKPLAVNWPVPMLEPACLRAALASKVDAVTLFWGEPALYVEQCKRAGVKLIWQCGSAEEAAAAKRAGVDAIIAQGVEAGGHVRGTVSTLALIGQVRDAIGDLPMLAAGGLADGRGLAAALALGADGAVFGTRFLASTEAAAQASYKQRIVEAQAEDTIYTKLFDIGWPDAAHRVLRTKVVAEWERAGEPEPGKRPGEGKPIGTFRRPGLELPLVRYSVMPPSRDVAGEIDELPFYAGQSCGLVKEILPAGELVRRIAREAAEIIGKRLAPLAATAGR